MLPTNAIFRNNFPFEKIRIWKYSFDNPALLVLKTSCPVRKKILQLRLRQKKYNGVDREARCWSHSVGGRGISVLQESWKAILLQPSPVPPLTDQLLTCNVLMMFLILFHCCRHSRKFVATGWIAWTPGYLVMFLLKVVHWMRLEDGRGLAVCPVPVLFASLVWLVLRLLSDSTSAGACDK